jgi:hypothetical protein
MSGDEPSDLGTVSQVFLEHLEETGFFNKSTNWKTTLKALPTI